MPAANSGVCQQDTPSSVLGLPLAWDNCPRDSRGVPVLAVVSPGFLAQLTTTASLPTFTGLFGTTNLLTGGSSQLQLSGGVARRMPSSARPVSSPQFYRNRRKSFQAPIALLGATGPHYRPLSALHSNIKRAVGNPRPPATLPARFLALGTKKQRR